MNGIAISNLSSSDYGFRLKRLFGAYTPYRFHLSSPGNWIRVVDMCRHVKNPDFSSRPPLSHSTLLQLCLLLRCKFPYFSAENFVFQVLPLMQIRREHYTGRWPRLPIKIFHYEYTQYPSWMDNYNVWRRTSTSSLLHIMTDHSVIINKMDPRNTVAFDNTPWSHEDPNRKL